MQQKNFPIPAQQQFYKTNTPLILASGSPRRKQFFTDLGLTFEVVVADIDERSKTNESPVDFVKRLALEKATAVASNNQGAWVVGADTIVVIDDQILGKPENAEDALRILKGLNGRWHEVWTGFAICESSKKTYIQHAEVTGVKFGHHSDNLLKAYIATQEPMDKAGAYGIQGKGGLLVEQIKGSYSNVVGLPVSQLVTCLIEQQIISVS